MGQAALGGGPTMEERCGKRPREEEGARPGRRREGEPEKGEGPVAGGGGGALRARGREGKLGAG